jgi:hypothetical protein
MLVIDEVQNIVSEYGTTYNLINELIKTCPYNFPIIISSATPIFDKPTELALTINLLKMVILH